jgi:polyisoprenoid-binding protein YceI
LVSVGYRTALYLRRIAVAALLLAAVPAAFAADYTLDPTHTSVGFAVRHNDISLVRGRFDRLRGSVQYDPDAKNGSLLISVQTGSVDTGNSAVENVLRSDQFLEVDRYAEAFFTSERFVFEDGKLTAIEGKLSLHGTERPLRITVKRFVCREVAFGLVRHYTCGGDFAAVLKRSEFGMTRFLPEVADEVELTISGEALRP